MDFQNLARQVRDEIDSFGVPAAHPDQLGKPLPPEWYEAGLLEMRAALVEPYSQEVADHHMRPGEVLVRTVVIVADDGDQALLAFDPNPDGDFALVWRPERENGISNIRGDAVGCFLSI
jgi:hypothetical protein